jgi:hypothetical protein
MGAGRWKMSARVLKEFVACFGNSDSYDYALHQQPNVFSFINKLYAVVERHSEGCVVVHIPSGDTLTFDDFRNVFGACNFRVLHSDGSVVSGRNIGHEWLKHAGRRQVETLEDLENAA